MRTVQHHHAHVASVMGEHGLGLDDPVIGVAFDGTGYGTDGAVWGGEVLVAGYKAFRRVAHLAYVPLAGGDASVLRPYRMALAHLRAAGVAWADDLPRVAACPPRSAACWPTSSTPVSAACRRRAWAALRRRVVAGRGSATGGLRGAGGDRARVGRAPAGRGAYPFALHGTPKPRCWPTRSGPGASSRTCRGGPAVGGAARFHAAVAT